MPRLRELAPARPMAGGDGSAGPRSRVEVIYPDLAYFNEVDRGGHFAAWEEPELFSTEVRAAVNAMR